MRRWSSVLVVLLALLGFAPVASASPVRHPVVFVHGYSGSASQFETPARRLEANGYPASWISALEYDSTFGSASLTDVYAALDARITALLASTGASQVDLVAHSLGTAVSQGYLTSSPIRSARVAHYVNLDGASAASPLPVPALGVWTQLNPSGSLAGGGNVRLPNLGHTETVTSAASFTEIYRFLTGRAPRTFALVPRPRITLAGRAVLFPSNLAASGSLTVYRVSLTGHRLGRGVAVPLAADGSWGPFRASGFARYEFVLSSAGLRHHFYFEPFRRTDHLVRLLTSAPGTGVDALVQKSPTTTALTITRNQEWWQDSDRLLIDGHSVLDGVAPKSKLAIALFAFDAGLDGVSHPGTPVPALASIPFLTGVDLYLPAGHRPVSLVALRRGGGVSAFVIPSYPSTTDRVSIQFNDY